MPSDLIEAFSAIVGRSHCLIERTRMEPYLRDWRGVYSGRAIAVLEPATTAEVQAIAALASKRRIAIVPQGGNTGLAGAATPDEAGNSVVVSLRRMDKVRDIDAINNTILVEAGCILASVQAAAEAMDRFFPLSLAAEGSCTIGGNLATNAGGVNVLKYGTARDLALGLEVVLADGSLYSELKSLRKDSTGYDLKHLFIGSEGTLGIITAATLKLFPKLRQRWIAMAALASLEAAPALLSRLRASSDDRLVSFELVPRLGFELAREVYPKLAVPFDSLPEYSVVMELATSSNSTELGQVLEESLAEAIETSEITDGAIAQSHAQAQDMWRWREGMVEGQHRRGPGIKHDVSVPVSRVPEFIARANALMVKSHPELQVLAFGHIGDGNVHYNVVAKPDTSKSQLESKTAAINKVVHDLVDEMGGSISAEHGIGQLRRQEFQARVSPFELSLMRDLKKRLDPLGLMNPGKVL